ncbi:putative serine/threonine-protein kinase drkD [Gracilariopsis chorda]|uniref:non-specific serine/threonine protein kinase n=1 Tax=Gracilariopsis chorda TaxID=448386 RepID=A0A2V3J5A3_9FLOR|nr:putative serine/threonine-protein kinase drkD [Gracilariopsis chorda]|eukprot:PXF49585.1 putative serine/threonine-protein kinase drkD [Gracilariopsis chorda]
MLPLSRSPPHLLYPVSRLSNPTRHHSPTPPPTVNYDLAANPRVNPSATVQSHLNLQKHDPDEVLSDFSGTIALFDSQTKHNTRPRCGFNQNDFEDSEDYPNHSLHRASASQSSISTSSYSQQQLQIAARESIYHLIDSIPAAVFFITLALLDYCTFSVSTLTHSSRFDRFYSVLDWITAIAFFIEVNARVYSYGFWFYVHGLVRSFEYVVSAINFIFIIAFAVTAAPWLLIARSIRILRLLTTALRLRDRHLKWTTRLELENLAKVLEAERSEQSKLTKWRIGSSVIAVGEQAGHGGFGTVYSGLFRGTLVAVKQISHAERNTTKKSIEDEAITLVNLRHPNVVLFMGFVDEPSKLWIVTEYCSRGSVRDRLDDADPALTEGRILKLALGAARGLAYLHGQQPPVLHLDLKTSNILISSGWDAKLGDFGLSRSIDNIENNWFSGTMQYAAPEILEANMFTTAADIYSFGICLWEMAAKEIPYEHMDPPAVLWGVVKSNLRPPIEKIIEEVPAQVAANITATPVANVFENRPQTASPGAPRTVLTGKHPVYAASTITPCTTPSSQPVSSGNATSQSAYQNKTVPDFVAVDVHDITMDKPTHRRTATSRSSLAVPIVPPLRMKHIDAQQTGRDSETMYSSGTGAEFSEDLDTATKKRSHLRGIQRGARGEQASSALNNLSTKVTATIQMFDDRPPIIRRREEDGSLDNGYENASSIGEGNSMLGSPRFPSIVRQTIKPKIIGRAMTVARGKAKSQTSNTVVSNQSVVLETREESDPFMRRLVSFSRRTGNANKQRTEQAEERDGGSNMKKKGKDDTKEYEKQLGRKAAKVPKEYIELIKKCWAQDAEDRPSASELVWQLVIMMDCQMREK